MNPIIQEFRDSLPLILEGRDPLEEYGEEWYLEMLSKYVPGARLHRVEIDNTGQYINVFIVSEMAE